MNWKLYWKCLKETTIILGTAWKRLPNLLSDLSDSMKYVYDPLAAVIAALIAPILFITYPFFALWLMRWRIKRDKEIEKELDEFEKSRNYHGQVKENENEV